MEELAAVTGPTVDVAGDDPVAAARQAVIALHTAEVRLSRQRIELGTELELSDRIAADAALAEAMDAGGDTAGAIRRTGTIRSRIGAVDRAIVAARRQRLEAIPLVWAAEAARLRERAAEALAAADVHEARTQELLAALKEHEGVDFVPFARRLGGVQTLVIDDVPQGGGIPRSRALRVEAADLVARAATIPLRKVAQGGQVTAASRDELLELLVAWDPLRIAPVLSQALTAYDDAAAAEVARRRRIQDGMIGYVAPDAPVTVTLTWQDGQITTAAVPVVRVTPTAAPGGVRIVDTVRRVDEPIAGSRVVRIGGAG